MRQTLAAAVSSPREEESGWKIKLRNFCIMLGFLGLTVLLTELLRLAGVEAQSLLMLYILSVVVISCVTPKYFYGVAAALVATLVSDFLITEPRLVFTFTMRAPITLLTMLLVTFITSTLTVQIKTQARHAVNRENRAQLLYEMNQQLLGAPDTAAIVRLTLESLIAHLKCAAIFYTGDPRKDQAGSYQELAYGDSGTGVFHTEQEERRVHRIFASGGDDPAVHFDGDDPEVAYFPVFSQSKLLGLIGVHTRSCRLTQGSLTFIHLLAGQAALSLELHDISDEQNRILVEAEKEKMRSTLLRAISHDLRTPLTSILGASSTILEHADMPRETLEGLVEDINENAQWLTRMVDNILTITKISRETMKVSKTLEAAEEVVSQSVAIVRKRFPDWQIHVRIPDELLMVPMDATLISQVLINLLENAVRNSPSGSLVLLNLKRQGDFARFDVTDNGRGIPESVLGNLFEARAPTQDQMMDSVRGIGIGLSICQTIIQAHGGQIEGMNRPEGGAKFTFLLPLSEDPPAPAVLPAP